MTNLPPNPPQVHTSREADVLMVRLDGDYTLDAVIYLNALRDAIVAEYGYYLELMDVSNAGPITWDARRALLSQPQRLDTMGGCAIIGANFAIRTLAQMVTRALCTLSKYPSLPIRFFDDEREARAWLEKSRGQAKARTVVRGGLSNAPHGSSQ